MMENLEERNTFEYCFSLSIGPQQDNVRQQRRRQHNGEPGPEPAPVEKVDLLEKKSGTRKGVSFS